MIPIVSVVMPVYNGEKYLRQAIESILNQTFDNFEFLIIDDCSIDQTASILEKYCSSDRRVRIFTQPRNLGVVSALNLGLDHARGKYIARMDADDICLPKRFQRQVEFMETHAEISICGSCIKTIGERSGKFWRYPLSHDAIYASMLFACALVHSSVMIRAEDVAKYNLRYDRDALHVEDYDLWSKAIRNLWFANLPDVLLLLRLHAESISQKNFEEQMKGRSAIYRRFFSYLDLPYSEADLSLHGNIGAYQFENGEEFLQSVREWFNKIRDANQRTGLISSIALEDELMKRWAQISKSTCLPRHETAAKFIKILGINKMNFGWKVASEATFLLERGFVKTQKWARKDLFP